MLTNAPDLGKARWYGRLDDVQGPKLTAEEWKESHTDELEIVNRANTSKSGYV